ncbi:MAG: hypothetical protein D6785_08995 [Planctomycetota bacterium]|nr:MAG: hypothetical protein D6785_08995 [Planctomycetota bacterium]
MKSKEEIEEEISKNEQFTLKKYKEILDSEKFEVKNLKQRIKANEKLISQYRKKLHLTEKELERVRVELTTKAILLKRSKDEGRISTEEFNREFKRIHDRLNMESRELQADISFYKRELDRAENTLRRLKEELKVKEEAQRVARDYEKKYGGKRKFTNAEFEKIYKKFKSLLPRKLKPVFENNPFRSPFLREK